MVHALFPRISVFSRTYSSLVTATKHNRVTLLTLNRPAALNALSSQLITDLNTHLHAAQKDESVGAVVITGSGKAFAAGADITELKTTTFSKIFKSDMLGHWGVLANFTKPTIAAVNGVALGGGCEIAMMCDIIYASQDAKFGQPEIKLGIIPGKSSQMRRSNDVSCESVAVSLLETEDAHSGAGGTQRLTHAIGKSRAMEIVLSGKPFSAQDAHSWGLVSKLFPTEEVVKEAIKLGETIATNSLPVTMMAKEAVNSAYEATLSEGLHLEQRLFQSAFALNDQKEGMSAFAEKRAAKFTHD